MLKCIYLMCIEVHDHNLSYALQVLKHELGEGERGGGVGRGIAWAGKGWESCCTLMARVMSA